MRGDAAFNRRVLRVFEDLLDQSPASWAEQLDLTCADDPAVRDAVRAMVDAHRSCDLLPTLPPEPRAMEDEPAPSRVGQYRVLHELGRGGMGVVYLAERADGLFDHRVAIKLIRRASLPERARATFVAERQILARLRHPHIAQMHDGGTTDTGAPYMVMECIEGAAITDHCAANRVDLRGRIALFGEACAAIKFAHRNLVVHADIKPSNVVVEEGFGVKLLDFGVARLLDETEEWRTHGFTPGYASPARIEGLPATPADDVYAAGVLLGELIEGQPGADDALQAIVAMATAPDPDARYGSIGDFAADLDRWQTHWPTRAAPPGRRRRALLFWHRHRIGLSVLTGAGLALSIALAVVVSLYFRSERHRLVAEQRYASSLQMADYVISNTDPALARVSGTLPVRKRLVEETGARLRDLEANGAPSPALKREMAAGYLRMAQIYGLDPSGGLGDFPAAMRSLDRANRLIDEAAVQDPQAPRALFLRGRAKLLEGNRIFDAPTGAEAKASLTALAQARVYLRKYLALAPGDVDAKLALWGAEAEPERDYSYLGRPRAGLPMLEAALSNATMPTHTLAQRRERDFYLNGSYLLLGEANIRADPRRAGVYFTKLIAGVTAMQRDGNSDWEDDLTQASGLDGLSRVEASLNDHAAAIRHAEAAIAALRRLYATERNHEMGANLSIDEARLADLFARQGRFGEARRMSDTAIAWLRRDLADRPADSSRLRTLVIALTARAQLEDADKARAVACTIAREADAIWTSLARPASATPIDATSDGPAVKMRKLVLRDC